MLETLKVFLKLKAKEIGKGIYFKKLKHKCYKLSDQGFSKR